MPKAIDEIEVKVKLNLEFETDAKKLLEFLRKNYIVPDFVTGFTLVADIDSALTVEWRTLLQKKVINNG